jgi:MoaA/NifB/PqqE/SkfB family radical SAM enzyme
MRNDLVEKSHNFKKIESTTFDDLRLESLEIGVTSKCNFNCSYCCAYGKGMKDEFSAGEVIRVIDELPDLKRIKLSGGEVLICFETCVEIVKYCKQRGIEIQINSNGSLLNSKKIDTLVNAGLTYLHISLNFTNGSDFATFYNMDNKVFDHIIDAIKYCARQKSMDTIVETIIFPATEKHICDVHNLITDLGIKKHEIQLGIPVLQNDWKTLTATSDLVRVIKMIIDNKREQTELYFSCVKANLQEHVFKMLSDYAQDKNGVHFPGCIEGRRQLHLHANGDVLICELGYPVVINNIYKDLSLSEMLKAPPELLKKFIECHRCDKASFYNTDYKRREMLEVAVLKSEDTSYE